MSEEVIERIESKDPKALKIFFLLFFLLIPITGVLLVWTDGHAKIRNQALRFANVHVIPAMKEWSEPEILEIATPEYADTLREGEYKRIADEFGKLQSVTKLRASSTRAREEDDVGVVYAEVEFIGQFEKRPAKVWMTIKSLSTGEIDPRDKKKRVETWYIQSMKVDKR